MKFIYFADAALKEKILGEGIFLRANQRKINEESIGIFCYPMIKMPFKAPIVKDDYEDIDDYLLFKKEEQILNESLTIEEAWEVVGASRVKKDNKKAKKTIGVIFELEAKHWPITVFIDIHHFIANEFAIILSDNANGDIIYEGNNNSLLETIKKIVHKKYVIANAPFTVMSEVALIDLINKFQQAGGGLWKEDSFECMIVKEISNNQIQETIALENKYYNLIVKNIWK